MHDSTTLAAAIKTMWAAFAHKPGDDGLAAWLGALAPLDGPGLRQAIREATEGEQRPNLGAVKARASHLRDSAKRRDAAFVPQLTQGERERADAACVMSLLWLHYECGWSLDELAGHVIARQLGKVAREALESAKQQLDRDRVFAWMSAQARKDPLPGDAEHAKKGRIAI